MPIGRSTIGKATPAVPWHARCVAPVNPERWASTVVLGDGDTVLIRPITPDDRDALAAVPRTSVARQPVPALLHGQATAQRVGAGPLHADRLRRPRRARRRGARRVHRLGQLRAVAEPRRRRLGVHGRRPAPRQGHRHAAARAPRGDRQVERDHPVHRRGARPTTGRCCRCSREPVGRCNAASSPASSTSTSSSPTRASSSTPSSDANSAPTRGRSPGCSFRARSR